jgi:hypothetical protein
MYISLTGMQQHLGLKNNMQQQGRARETDAFLADML